MTVTAKDRFKQLLKVPYPDEVIDSTDIPVFGHREWERDRDTDKYDKDFAFVDQYTGYVAYSYLLLRKGSAEGLYRTINLALLSNLKIDDANNILDLGCGVGRTIYSCAELFPQSFFVGMDYAYNMCQRAKEILVDGKTISLGKALAHTGFDSSALEFTETKTLDNVFIAQGSALDLPFNPDSFDCVINTYLIDRIKPDPVKAIEQMAFVLKPGGLFILSDPLNFDDAAAREKIPTLEVLIELLDKHGIRVIEWFDGLVYREVKDICGNFSEWSSFIFIGQKG